MAVVSEEINDDYVAETVTQEYNYGPTSTNGWIFNVENGNFFENYSEKTSYKLVNLADLKIKLILETEYLEDDAEFYVNSVITTASFFVNLDGDYKLIVSEAIDYLENNATDPNIEYERSGYILDCSEL